MGYYGNQWENATPGQQAAEIIGQIRIHITLGATHSRTKGR